MATVLSALLEFCEAAPPVWRFAPQRLGYALLYGGWVVDREIDTISAAPEFSFPIQLVYQNTRRRRGIFGSQWYSPQLESYVLPRGLGEFIWSDMSGRLVPFRASQLPGKSLFYDREEQWLARVNHEEVEIANSEGWSFLYSKGRPVRITSPTKRVLEFSYANRRLSQVAVRDGLAKSADGGVTLVSLDYDPAGRITSLTINGAVHFFTSETGKTGLLASWKRPGGINDLFSYSPVGELAFIQSGNGEKISFKTQYVPPRTDNGRADRDSRNQRQPANYWLVDDGTREYTYGDARDARKTTKFSSAQWDSTSIATVDRFGARALLKMDSKLCALIERTDGEGEKKTFYYLAPGKPFDGKVRRVQIDGKTMREFEYDPTTGALASSTDDHGVKTSYSYTMPKAARELADFQPAARARISNIAETKAGTYKTLVSFSYDNHLRIVSMTDGEGKVDTTEYSSRGDISGIKHSDGTKIKFTVDALGRSSAISDGVREQGVTYDAWGHVTARRLPDGQKVNFQYDPRGNVVQVIQNSVVTARYQRNAAGQIIAETDAIGRTKRYERDPHGNLLVEILPDGSTTRYEYDSRNLRTAQIDGKGNRTTFRYNALRRLIEQKNALDQTLTWSYDSKGNLAERTNGVQTIRYEYDDFARLKSVDYGKPDERIEYERDGEGSITSARLASINWAIFCDDKKRLIARQIKRGDTERVVRYGYDSKGRKTSVTLSERSGDAKAEGVVNGYRILQQTDYAYDDADNLKEIRSNGRPVSTFKRDPASGRILTRTYGNGMVATFAYDKFGRQTQFELKGGPIVQPLMLAYAWDDAGQMLARVWNGEAQYYSYDVPGRLAGVRTAPVKVLQKTGVTRDKIASATSPIETYQYDGAGNIIEKMEHGTVVAMTYDAANQIVRSQIAGGSETRFAYDPAGRLVETAGEGGTTRRDYGLLDKVMELTKPDGQKFIFEYDPDGMLAAKRNLAPAEETGGAGEDSTSKTMPAPVSEEFIWDGLALLYRNGETFAVEPHPSGGIPLAVSRDPHSEPDYIVTDILGTTLAVVRGGDCAITPLTAFGRPVAGVGSQTFPQNKSGEPEQKQEQEKSHTTGTK